MENGTLTFIPTAIDMVKVQSFYLSNSQTCNA